MKQTEILSRIMCKIEQQVQLELNKAIKRLIPEPRFQEKRSFFL